jgi:hypothetical protein
LGDVASDDDDNGEIAEDLVVREAGRA